MSRQPMHLALLAGGEPFDGASPEEQALGGSETACVQMARALAQRGHEVHVFCHCPRPGRFQDVQYSDLGSLARAAGAERFDVAVISRAFPLLDLPLQAGLKVLWNHDILDQPSALASRLEGLDLCLVLSSFHARNFALALPECGPLLMTTRNGLDLELLDRATAGVRPVEGRVCYVSRPERGLRLLLQSIWPRLRARMPELSLHLCGYQVGGEILDPGLQREYLQIAQLIRRTPGVKVLGALAKADYYRHLASCQALLYPCTFPEVSCIAALEAQATATPIITSDDFALSETVVTPEFRVAGRPGSVSYVDAYLQRALELLGDPPGARQLARQARRAVRALHAWDAVAAQWEALFSQCLDQRLRAQAPALAASLVLGGDRAAAQELLQRPLAAPSEGPAPPDPEEEDLLWRLARELTEVLEQAGPGARVGVISADQGRTARHLAELLPEAQVQEADGQEPAEPIWQAVVIRDRLEREAHPAELLQWALRRCQAQGRLLLCVAAGAWPLLHGGHAARLHDLGRRELAALLPGRQLMMSFLPRGLVGRGTARYFAGRWLVSAPAAGPEPGDLDPLGPWRRARPAPDYLLAELQRAGLI